MPLANAAPPSSRLAANGRPGAPPAGGRPADPKAALNKRNEVKKKFEYSGPDGDLAQMLERDVMDGTPNIKWDDIAGLQVIGEDRNVLFRGRVGRDGHYPVFCLQCVQWPGAASIVR